MMHTMTVHRSENGLLYSSGMLTAYEDSSGLQYSLMPPQQQTVTGTGNHVSYLSDGHQHLHRHLGTNEGAHATITVNPMAIASEQAMPSTTTTTVGDETCRERKKTFYILICLIVLGISVMVITVITAIVIFFKCESSALFFRSLQSLSITFPDPKFSTALFRPDVRPLPVG